MCPIQTEPAAVYAFYNEPAFEQVLVLKVLFEAGFRTQTFWLGRKKGECSYHVSQPI
jgi:hypothetical protein